MFEIKSKEDTRKFVSALRRELSAQGIALSHNKTLDLLAKSLGFGGAEELSAKYPEPVQAAKPSVVSVEAQANALELPLRNDGQFDFCETGVMLHGVNGALVLGRVEDIESCISLTFGATRDADGELDMEFQGTTEVNWDGQAPRLSMRGRHLYQVSGIQDFVEEPYLVVAPEGLDTPELVGQWMSSKEASAKYVRNALVQAYAEYLQKRKPLQLGALSENELSTLCAAEACNVGFSLTAAELDALRVKLMTS